VLFYFIIIAYVPLLFNLVLILHYRVVTAEILLSMIIFGFLEDEPSNTFVSQSALCNPLVVYYLTCLFQVIHHSTEHFGLAGGALIPGTFCCNMLTKVHFLTFFRSIFYFPEVSAPWQASPSFP